MTTILTIIISVVFSAAVALPTVVPDTLNQAIGPGRGAVVALGRRGGGRTHVAKRRGRSQKTVVQNPGRRFGFTPQLFSGSITDVRPVGQRGANAFAAAFDDVMATAVFVDNRTAVVFTGDRLSSVLAGRPRHIEVTAPVAPARKSGYEVFGVDGVIENPTQVRFQRIGLDGRHDDGTDVVMANELVFERPRMTEVPTTGYCMVCRDRVYRADLVRVYVDRYGDGMWDEDEVFKSSGPYANATRGTCQSCGMDKVVRLGTHLTESVRVNDHAAGYVRPKPKVAAPRAGTPEGAVPNPAAFCMKCRDIVDRRDVSVTRFSNGRPATVGACPRCECRVYRAGGPQLPDMVVHVRDPRAKTVTPYCGDRDAATVASTENDAMDIMFLETYDPDRFVIRCGTCEDHSVGNAWHDRWERAIAQDAALAMAVTTREQSRACPDDVMDVDRPTPGFDPDDYYRHRSDHPNGDRFEFTAYSRSREKSYTCYWDPCRNAAGWHGFRRPGGFGSDEYHICARHWRVAMGYSSE